MKAIIEFKINHLKINDKFSLNNVNFSIYENKINTIIGKNGSGKSSILNLLVKNYKLDNNDLFIDNKDINKISYKELSHLISFIPQINTIHEEMLVYDYLELCRSIYANFLGFLSKKEKNKIIEVTTKLQISNLIYKTFKELSGGERQKVLISGCLVQDTPIIVMDEPLTYLDLNNQIEILDLIKSLKNDYSKTIILVLHELEYAYNVSDQLTLMNNGNLVCSNIPKNVLTTENMKKYLNINASFKIVENKNKLIY